MRYRFEVLYCPRFMQQSIKLMRALDVDMEGAGLVHVLEFSSSKSLSIEEVKKHLISAYKSDDCEVLSIQGGVIE